jgi:endonuclease YncB( thermonuclease family)
MDRRRRPATTAVRSPRHLIVWLVIIAVGAAVTQILKDWQDPTSSPPRQTADIVTGRARVVDGDSLEIGRTRIRLFGIDAPEGRQDCRDAQDKTYRCGTAARRELASLIGSRDVSCTPVGQSHDRRVAVCKVEGRDLSESMIRKGFAVELRQHSKGRYAAAEREAREAKRGLWAGSFERPGDWRHQHMR